MEQGGDAGASLPRFVVGEFESYLACGVLEHGFARVRCAACGDELLVAFRAKDAALPFVHHPPDARARARSLRPGSRFVGAPSTGPLIQIPKAGKIWKITRTGGR